MDNWKIVNDLNFEFYIFLVSSHVMMSFKFCIVIEFTNAFSRNCSVHQHGCCDVT